MFFLLIIFFSKILFFFFVLFFLFSVAPFGKEEDFGPNTALVTLYLTNDS
jgi:hypothetical protein